MKTLRTPKPPQTTPCVHEARHGTLSGETRLRRNWRGKLVLQVAVKDSEMLGPDIRKFWRWRDATVFDLCKLIERGL